MEIFYNNEPIRIDGQPLDLQVTDNSFRHRAIMGEDSLTLYFSLPQYVDIPVGAYVMFQGDRYELMSPQNFKKNNTRDLEYTLVLDGPAASLSKYKMRDTTSQTDDKVTGRLKFSFTGKPEEHLAIVVKNLNDREGGWSVGSVIDAPEKVIAYSQNTLSEALNMIAQEFETEWDIRNKVINLRKVEYNKENPLPLSYGKGNGFKSGVSRTSENERAMEVLFVQGGEKNIDPAKYGAKELLLPKSQEIEYEGVVYVTDAEGYSVTRKTTTPAGSTENVLPKQEGSLDLSNIYPSRVGHVSEVVPVDPEKNFYDIADSSIPESLNYTDYIIPGETMTLIFQTGMLAGKEFEVNYKHAEKRFEIVPQIFDGVTMPGGVFIPKGPSEKEGYPGDEYAVFNISLPDAYICDNATKTGASWEMLREAVKHLHENEAPHYSFTGELDPIWIKEHWTEVGGKITLGGYIAFSDPQFAPAQQEGGKEKPGILIRITGIKDYVNNPYSPVIELSNVVSGGGVSSELNKIDSNEQLAEEQYKDSVRFTKRRISDVKETISMLEDAMLGFSASVTPITVQTMHLLLGHESLQYRFVSNTTTPEVVVHDIHFDAATKRLVSDAGIIQHMTLNINTISPAHQAKGYKFWNIANATNTPVLDIPQQAYYVYLKVEKNGENGVFLPSPNAIGMEDDPAYYHLLAGILNSEAEDGTRAFMPMYGFTEISPGRITVSKIESTNGKTYFDLDKGEIAGKIVFSSDSQTEDGQTIIQGGKINANLIDADKIKATDIEAVSGSIATFGINGNYLEGNGQKIIFQNEDIETLSSLTTTEGAEKLDHLGVDGTSGDTNAMADNTLKDYLELSTSRFTVGYAGVLKFAITGQTYVEGLPLPEGQYAKIMDSQTYGNTCICRIYKIEEDNTHTVVYSSRVTLGWGKNDPKTTNFDVYLVSPGTYSIDFRRDWCYDIEWVVYPGTPPEDIYPIYRYDTSVHLGGQDGSYDLYFLGSLPTTKIGTNGIYSFWSVYNYLYFSQNEGLNARSNIKLSSPNGLNFIDIKDSAITIGGKGLDIEAPIGTDISTAKASFTIPGTRQNIISGETMSTMLGKIYRYQTDLKNVAFSGAYSDLTGRPTSLPANGGAADTATMDGNGNNIVATYATKSETTNAQVGARNYITGMKENWTGGLVKSDGTIDTANNYNQVTKDFQDIAFLAGKNATASVNPDDVVSGSERLKLSFRFAFYTSDKAFISFVSSDANATQKTFVVPQNAAYCKASVGVGIYGYVAGHFEDMRFQLELGTKATDYYPAPQDLVQTYYNKAGDIMTGTLKQKKENSTILTDVASLRIPWEHKGWIALDFGLDSITVMGEIYLYKYGWGSIVVDFSGYTYVGTAGANNWHAPRFGVRGSISSMPQIVFAKDNATGHRYILIGGDDFAWGQYDYIALPRVVLGSISNDTRDRTWAFVAKTGSLAQIGVTTAYAGDASINIEVDKARNADTVDGIHAAAVGTIEAGKLASYNANKALNANTLILPPTSGSIRWQYSAANPDINVTFIEKSAEQEIVVNNKYGSGDILKIFRIAAGKADTAFSVINNGNIGIGVQPIADNNKLTVQGNAKFAGEVTAAAFRGTADKASRLVSFDARTTNPSNFPTQTVSCYFVSRSVTGTGSSGYVDVLGINGYSDTSGGSVNSLIFPKNEFRIYHSQVTFGTTSYGTPKALAYAEELPRVTYSGAPPASPRNGDIWIIPTD